MPLALANGYKRLSCLSQMEHYSLCAKVSILLTIFQLPLALANGLRDAFIGFSQNMPTNDEE